MYFKDVDIVDFASVLDATKDCDYIFVIWGKITGGYPGPKYHLLEKVNKKK